MSMEMYIMNIAILVLLSFLMENGLRKVQKENSSRVKRAYWNLLMPTYVLSAIFTVLLLFLGTTESLESLLTLQKYAMGVHVLACLLFIAALDGARTSAKAVQ